MAATFEGVDLGVGHVAHQISGHRIGIKEFCAVVVTVLGPQILILAIDRLGKAPQQHHLGIARKQRVPLRSPEHFDNVPASADEQAFQFLNDLTITTHRPIEALQIAVDDKRQVVEALARRQRQTTERLWLVHFAIAKHTPDVALRGIRQTTPL